MLTVAGCSGDDPPEVSLPFGLEQIAGTEAIGTPAVVEEESYEYQGEEIRIRSVRAAFRVTSDDPGNVFRRWVEQLDVLAIAQVDVTAGVAADDPWLSGVGFAPFEEDGPPPDSATLKLWATDDDPLLFVDITHAGREDDSDLRIAGARGRLPSPPPLKADKPSEGDVLFRFGNDDLHIPDGASGLTPLLPDATGGGVVVLATGDMDGAVEALLEEAQKTEPDGELSPVVEDQADGVRTVSADYVVVGGRDVLRIVGVESPDEGEATLYVSVISG